MRPFSTSKSIWTGSRRHHQFYGPILFQYFLFLCRTGALELRDLIVALELQGGPKAFEQLETGSGALGVANMLAEIVGESPVVSTIDECINRRLVVLAPAQRMSFSPVPE